ncbi:CPBP family intramembrane glutamic endopeptidase [Marinimicrobium sp. ABcell2]|uniref:CPBP family intramembrane glutamic endopeptidase n=1 Tax=Marinimicrobium sp. ABcell2 TaxID=3069751 RepID=UPI0027B5FE74|nr:CPBP family intramembrane glutamic endopeptidase [Marinimicrobium sp. ABcell2]MDQ2075544.1 CPBP family intramembrane glutamic endopeptidase [Marinimicrobium sp. ABcell2]
MSSVSNKTRVFWALFIIVSVLVAIAGLRLLISAYSTFDLDITFSREDALDAALDFREARFPELDADRTAIEFSHNQQLQAYVELEGGGFQRYRELLDTPDAAAQFWLVRQFAENQERELRVAYTPSGEPLSFSYTVPDTEPGAALEQADALRLAESEAEAFLGQRFHDYAFLEASTFRQPSGRLDHHFTFEHQQLLIHDARIRLNVRVAGDQLVTIAHRTHIPADFGQRFSEMRSLNHQISQISLLSMAGLFGLGGLLLGGIWLHRRGALHWCPALLPSAFIGIGLGASALSQLPLAWMNYQTTDSAANFLLMQVVSAFGVIVFATLVFSIIYAVAEGMSRLAFPSHPRLYDFFQPSVAASPEIRARVVGAYSFACWLLLYAGVFALLANQFLGWWSPALPQQDPNTLANWRPALQIIFTALQAGFWEESLFRAIPLGLAGIIGARFGIQKPLVIAVLILQAIIFAGVHANYPQLPGYYRLVELFLPALALGVVYLRFGLMVCILAHFQYNLILMATLLFAADASGLWLDRILVALAFLAPLVFLAWARYRAGNVASLNPQWRNGQPGPIRPPSQLDTPVTDYQPSARVAKSFILQPRWLFPLAAVSLVLIVLQLLWPSAIEWPEYQINRAEAKALARDTLESRDIKLSGDWRATVRTSPGRTGAREFVWHNSGPEAFRELLGTYLDVSTWAVTWRNFGGPVEERTERWRVWINPDGTLQQVEHRLPEAAPGADLDRETALATAEAALQKLSWGDPVDLDTSSLNQNTRPARTDWSITFSDRNAYFENDGEAIIQIQLAGENVARRIRTIDVPNHWLRAQAEQRSQRQPFRVAAITTALALFVIAIGQFFLLRGGRKPMRIQSAWPWMLITVSGALMVSVLWADIGLGELNTAGSWSTQVSIMVSGWVLEAALVAVFVFLAAQALYAERPLPEDGPRRDYSLGASLALVFGGLQALQHLLLPSTAAPSPYVADYSSYVPWLTSIFGGFSEFTPALLQLLVALGLARFLVSGVRWLMVGGLALLWLGSMTLASAEPLVAFYSTSIRALTVLALVLLIRQRQTGVAIALVTLSIAINRIGIANAIYPYAWLHALLAVASIALVAYWLLTHWYRNTQPLTHFHNGRKT